MTNRTTNPIVAVLLASLCCAQAATAADTPVAPNEATSVSQYGITLTFDKPHQVGQFVNGDWWVVGPVTVQGVTPAPGPAEAAAKIDTPKNRWGDTSLKNDNRMRNGSMIVLKPGGKQGYDSRSSYDPALSVTFPCTIEVDRSLISSISNATLPVENFPAKIMWASEKSCQNVLKTVAVLTVLAEPPPADAFRPPYVGTSKPLYRAGSLKWDLLQKLAVPDIPESAYTPSYTLRLPRDWEQMERYFQRPWLDHILSWTQQQINPNENVPNYGREHGRLVSLASLMLHLDAPKERKEKLLIGLVQYGIDTGGLARVGATWNRGGGHTSGRKWPVLFASLMLDAPELRTWAEGSVFHEDAQTYYGIGWFGQTALYWMVDHHGPRERYEEKRPEQWNDWDRSSEGYRISSNVQAWIGSSLSALLMKARPAWNHDAFFDYCDRWMDPADPLAANRGASKRPKQEGSTYDPFVDAMWKAYRARVPEQPLAGDDRMWVHAAGGSKWVPNPKPTPEAVAAVQREHEAKLQAQEQAAQDKYGKDVAQQQADAKTAGVPEDFVLLIQAEKFSAEGGGKVTVEKKRGADGEAFRGWDKPGHWLEYTFELAQDGYYQVVFKYARSQPGTAPGARSLLLDGVNPCPEGIAIAMANTGGWEAWRMYPLQWPDFAVPKPFLVKMTAGKHTLRLDNVSGGGVNLDYILIAAPFLAVTTETRAK